MKEYRSDKQTRVMQELFDLCKTIDCRNKKEKQLNLNIKYGDSLIKTIVKDSFRIANTIEELPKILKNKKQYQRNCISSLEEIKGLLDGSIVQEYPLIYDCDTKEKLICRYGEKTFEYRSPALLDLSWTFDDADNVDKTPYHLYNGLYYTKACLLACKNGHLNILKNNLESCNRAKSIFDDNYLITAAKNEHEDIVNYLIDRGLNVQLALKFGTPKIKTVAQEWIDNHPNGQTNLEDIKNDYEKMLKNPPEWMNRFSHFRLTVSKAEENNGLSSYDEDQAINMVYESVAYIRNNAGEVAVQKYLDKILLKEPRPEPPTAEEIAIVGKKLLEGLSYPKIKPKV